MATATARLDAVLRERRINRRAGARVVVLVALLHYAGERQHLLLWLDGS